MIIAVANNKGGVGKTTTAVNLSAALAGHAAKKRRVLLIDLDGQASASLSLGVPRNDLEPSSADLIFDRMPARWAVRPTAIPGLELITASETLFRADWHLGHDPDRETRLREELEPIRLDYDFIILDCPPTLSLIPINALLAADGLIVPASPQFLSCEGLQAFLGAVLEIASAGERSIQTLGILLTLVDARSKSVQDCIRRVRERFGKLVFEQEIKAGIKIAEAPGQGKTIDQHAAGSPGAVAYKRLAAEVLKRASLTAIPSATGSPRAVRRS